MGDSKRCLCQALMGEGVVCQPALFRLLRHSGIHRLREDMSAAGEELPLEQCGESKDRVLQVMSDAAALVQCAYTRSAVTWTQLQLLLMRHVRNRLSPFRICFGGDCVETPVDVIPEVSFPVPYLRYSIRHNAEVRR